MRKFLFLLAPAMLVAGCAREVEFADPESVAVSSQEGVFEAVTRSLDGAVYNEVVDAWMIPQEAGKVEQSKTRSAANTFTEKSPYTVTYENYESTAGGPEPPRTFQLPILYTVWPVEKPLPADLEYVLDYEVFLPRASSLSEEAIHILGGEAIARTRGGSTRAGASSGQTKNLYFEGSIYAYDDQMGQNVPMQYLNVSYQNGSYVINSNTGVTGKFGIFLDIPEELEFTPFNMYVTVRHNGSLWKITTGSNTTPHTSGIDIPFLPDVGQGRFFGDFTLPTSSYQINEIHRGAAYFFSIQNAIPKPSLSGGIKIIANSGPDLIYGSKGYFDYPYYAINIFNDGSTDASVIGTTLHEIGHFTHCYSDANRYSNTPRFLKESFAPYCGWYFTHEYYRSHGRTIYPDQDITINGIEDGQGSQMWDKTSPSYYTPLFVDLTDNMNQIAYYGYFYPQNYPNDHIMNIPPSVIWNIITNNTSWAQFRDELEGYAGTGSGKYYTVAQFDAWIAAFDDWLVTYSGYLNVY